MHMEKAKRLSEIRVTCMNYALDSDDLAKFYVDTSDARGVNMLKRLSYWLNYTPGIYPHILYMGHKGSGKSTLLYQLEQNLSESYKIIRYSVQDTLDMESMEFSDVLFSMYEQVYNSCAQFLTEHNEFYEDLNNVLRTWNSSIEKETEIYNVKESERSSETSVNIHLKIVNLFSRLSNILKNGTSERTIIRDNFSNDSRRYIESFNKLMKIATAYHEKPILLIIDDLEKISRDSAEKLFFKQSRSFPDIKAHLLLAAPIFLKYSDEFNRIHSQYFSLSERCPMIAVKNVDGTDNEVGIKAMNDIVYVRVSEELINRDVLRKAVIYSGGIIRDLFKMLCEASLLCEIDERTFITVEDIERAFIALQESLSDVLREKHIEALQYVYRNPRGLVMFSDVLTDLLCEEIIIEYNGEQWRGVHPAVVAFLDKHHFLDENKDESA